MNAPPWQIQDKFQVFILYSIRFPAYNVDLYCISGGRVNLRGILTYNLLLFTRFPNTKTAEI